jgi:succinate dehydrogenase flavin-adding protein (antitoxin of CptAB toxin-antitoxin module)
LNFDCGQEEFDTLSKEFVDKLLKLYNLGEIEDYETLLETLNSNEYNLE